MGMYLSSRFKKIYCKFPGFQVFLQAAEKLVVNEAPDKLNSVQLIWLYSIMIFATVVKLALWFYCRTSGNNIVRAYAKVYILPCSQFDYSNEQLRKTNVMGWFPQDHYFDVVTNVVGLAAAVLGDRFYWWIDPVGAIVLAVYTITNWSGTVWENAGVHYSLQHYNLAFETSVHLHILL
jgi:divalent metal cation (Fe/Co/Zn/Cd) transporter